MKTYVLSRVSCADYAVTVLGISDCKANHLTALDTLVAEKKSSDSDYSSFVFLLDKDTVYEYVREFGYIRNTKTLKYVYRITEFSDEDEFEDAQENLEIKQVRKNALDPSATISPASSSGAGKKLF